MILQNTIYFSCLPCSLLCFYYTGFSKKSLSDYCVKSAYISEIFQDFFVFITDYCYFILSSCKSARYFFQSFQRNIPLLLQKSSKKSIFNKYIHKISPCIFCFSSIFFLFTTRIRYFCSHLLCVIPVLHVFCSISPVFFSFNQLIIRILFAHCDCVTECFFARC